MRRENILMMETQFTLVNRLVERVYPLMTKGVFALFMLLTFTTEGLAKVTTAEQLQALKLEMVQLNMDVRQLKAQGNNAAEHTVSLYLSLEVNDKFDLYNIKIVIDNKLMLNKNYSDKEINALKQGGVQKLYMKNMVKAKHRISAFILGTNKQGKTYKQGATGHFDNTQTSSAIALKIHLSASTELVELTLLEL
tara:strand:- start:8779 stop:9360 length:582 start_codon:yes stop_codon:yes gene_type:complete